VEPARSDIPNLDDNIANDSDSSNHISPELSAQVIANHGDECTEQNGIEYYSTENDENYLEEEIEDSHTHTQLVTIITDELIREDSPEETQLDLTDKYNHEKLDQELYTESETVVEVINDPDSDDIVAEVTDKDDEDNTFEINTMIDIGFENKINGNIQEAVSSFETAFQLTDSPDLKYLLSQELVVNYEILGQYTSAINIMKNTIGSGLVPTAGLNQAQKKLEYLQRMVEELERLGMGEVPVSEVPRLVKIKVGHNY
jgi:hypothetical protein